MRSAPGTITGGLQVIAPRLAPVVEARRRHLVDDERWPVDETRWMVWSGEAAEAQRSWAELPLKDRVQVLYKLKALVEEQIDDLAGVITWERPIVT